MSGSHHIIKVVPFKCNRNVGKVPLRHNVFQINSKDDRYPPTTSWAGTGRHAVHLEYGMKSLPYVSRMMMIFWICAVPSAISTDIASRNRCSNGSSLEYP